MHMHPAPEMSQHHTAEAAPPASRGYTNVMATLAKGPGMETANEMHESQENSRLYTCCNLAGSKQSSLACTNLDVAHLC